MGRTKLMGSLISRVEMSVGRYHQRARLQSSHQQLEVIGALMAREERSLLQLSGCLLQFLWQTFMRPHKLRPTQPKQMFKEYVGQRTCSTTQAPAPSASQQVVLQTRTPILKISASTSPQSAINQPPRPPKLPYPTIRTEDMWARPTRTAPSTPSPTTTLQ